MELRQSLTPSICARTDEIAEALVREFESHRVEQTTDLNVVDVTFTYLAPNGANRTVRRVDVPRWPEIARNYVAPVRRAVEEVMALSADMGFKGRLVLFHGPPGTGKTTLIRAIASAWRSWCTHRVRHRSRRALRPAGVHVRSDVGRRR